MPDDEFDSLLAGKVPTRETASIMADHFNVSREAIYRKFLDRGLISEDEYTSAAKFWLAQIKKGPGKGNYYNSQLSYLGRQYVDLAFTRYYQHRIDEFQLSDYLNIKPKNLGTFELKYGTGR
jgi:Zn-dependent peptidase ImmA (M78 family)